VIARRRGSVAEIVDDGVTGWICEDEDDMVEAVHRLGAIDRAACRAAFEQRFTASTMARRYVDVYESILADTREPDATTANDRRPVAPASPYRAAGE
jgi:glycosyltransferase involved in cell wall biosynthesis